MRRSQHFIRPNVISEERISVKSKHQKYIKAADRITTLDPVIVRYGRLYVDFVLKDIKDEFSGSIIRITRHRNDAINTALCL